MVFIAVYMVMASGVSGSAQQVKTLGWKNLLVASALLASKWRPSSALIPPSARRSAPHVIRALSQDQPIALAASACVPLGLGPGGFVVVQRLQILIDAQ